MSKRIHYIQSYIYNDICYKSYQSGVIACSLDLNKGKAEVSMEKAVFVVITIGKRYNEM